MEDKKLVEDVNQETNSSIDNVESDETSKNKKLALIRVGRAVQSQEGWLFVLPALILMCIFTFYPIVNSFISAFKNDYKPLEAIGGTYDTTWGLVNFRKVITGETGTGGADFMNCLINTMLFTFISVPLSTILALLISVALNSIKPLQKAYQTVYFLPYLTNSLAMGAVFASLFNVVGTGNNIDTIGLINQLLGKTNDSYINWINIGSSVWANRAVVIIYEVWSGLPFKILILFSALQNVNKQYYDAARVDGASKAKILWKITVPMISPMISYLLITGIMGGMKVYTAVVGLFGESMGPNNDFEVGTMVGYLYNYIDSGDTGYAAAGSLILFAIIMIITIINLQISKKKVHY